MVYFFPTETKQPKNHIYGEIFGKNRGAWHKTMRKMKQGGLKSGSGDKVKSQKQAVAIALSEARDKGYKAPKLKESKTTIRSSKSVGSKKS